MTRLAGKVALVTGASRGIGESIARRLASDGAHVVNASIIDPTYSDVPSITFEHLDVTSPEAAREVIGRVAGDHGRLDILVNNAGVEVEKSVPDTSVDEWDHVMSVNVRGVFLMCKFAMEHLERTRGVVINMASVNAYWAEPDLAVYSASKAAVLQLTRCIALDHAAAGVRSVAICPGYVRTEMLEHYYQSQPDPQAVRGAVTGRHPLRRLCEPDEVASLASWLASDEAGFASGQPYILDGALTTGRSFTWNGT